MFTDIEELINAVRPRLVDYLAENGIDAANGKKFNCLNPDHDDKSPSMNMHKDGTMVKCFSCGCSGSVFDVANWLEDKPLVGPEWVTDNVLYLADKFGIKYNLITKGNHAATAVKHAYLKAYKIVADLIQKTANENPNNAWVSELKKRKWARKESAELGVGCINSFKDVLDVLYANNFTSEFVEHIGLMRPDIFNQDGVIFTVYDEYGRPIAFYMRDTKFEEKKAEYEKKDFKLELSRPKPPAKYNSTANFTGVYEKPLFPYGLHDVRNFHKIIVVEGHGCKHNLRLNNIDNVIALGGLALNESTTTRLSNLGVTNIALLLDNDSAGREKIKTIIRQYYGKIAIDFSVMDMSQYGDVKDPDEFIRKYGVELFKQIPEKNALEWLTVSELSEKGDPYTVLQDISPLIALERSPINRLKIINIIAELTGISRDVIQEEVNQKIAASKDRKGEFALKVLEEARELITMNPEALDAAVNLIESKIGTLNKASQDDDAFSSLEVLKNLVKLQSQEESGESVPNIITGYPDWDRLIPMPTCEAFTLIMGPPNTGKSSLVINRALRELEKNKDHIVIILTNDDSRDVYINRMVAALSKNKINWVKNPNYYLDSDKAKARVEAYRIIGEYIRDERLVIKDITHGNTVEYFGRLLAFYRDKYPQRTMSSFCDNLHRLDTEAGYEDGRFKAKAISGLMKSYTTKYDCNNSCTVEMTKDGMYDEPKDARSIAEAASLQFDANLIIYLWNEMNTKREEAKLTFDSSVMEYIPNVGYSHTPTIKPIIKMKVLKNKISEFKGDMFFLFHPELAIYDDITISEVHDILEQKDMKEKDAKEAKEREKKNVYS